MDSVRVRLVFEDKNCLNKSQRSLGLYKSWVLVKPQQFPTFSDLAAHLVTVFDLAQSCPHGLLLCVIISTFLFALLCLILCVCV